MMPGASSTEAALDAAITGAGLAVPPAVLPAVRAGVRRLAAAADRLRAAGFGDDAAGPDAGADR